MRWESLGFRENPFSTDPISQGTLSLYTGHAQEIKRFKHVLHEKNVLAVIEGARGVGTTSFANYLRFSAQAEHLYFTPRNEIRVEAHWNAETLLSAIIANVVREIELYHDDLFQDKRFQEAKTLSQHISEAYRAFGVSAFGFGVHYGKSAGVSSQPVIVPSNVLGHHLEDLTALICAAGYRYGLLIQLNNLDVPEVHSEEHLKYLFNMMRDYFQTDGISWLLVGDVGLRQFIMQDVDRLDDIVSYEEVIGPVSQSEYNELIQRRLGFYQISAKAELPMDAAVFDYLYDLTKGRLRYIFGLLKRLTNSLFVGDLTDRVTLEIAKPAIRELAMKRIQTSSVSKAEEQVLRALVKLESATPMDLVKATDKTSQNISNVLSRLLELKLVTLSSQSRTRIYGPALDAIVAYQDVK